MSQPQEPILVIAYNDSSRNVLAAEIEKNNLRATPCSSFAEAEEMALHSCYSGLLIDLPAIVKAKGEEKIIACTLASFFSIPLRVQNHRLHAGTHDPGWRCPPGQQPAGLS